MALLSILVALVAIAGIGFVVWRPQYAIVAIMAMFPLEQLFQSYFPFFVQRPIAFNILIAALAGFALLWRFGRTEPITHGYFNGVTICGILLYAWAWLALSWSPDPSNGMWMLRHGVPYWILMLVALPMLVSDVESFRRILFGLMCTGAAVCFLILISPAAHFHAGRLFIEFGSTAYMQRGNPLAIAELGGLVAVVAMLYRPRVGGWFVIGIRVAAIVIGLGLAISAGARGQVIAALASAFLVYPVARGLASAKQFMGVAGGLLIMVFAVRFAFQVFVSEENQRRWGVGSFESGFENRFELINMLWYPFLDSPQNWIQGLGTNAFFALSGGGSYVHNFVVEVVCELGLIGAVFAGGILWFTFRAALTLIMQFKDNPEQRAAVATIVALAMYGFLLSLKQGSFLGLPMVLLLPFMLAKIARTEAIALAEAHDDALDDAAWEEYDAYGDHDDADRREGDGPGYDDPYGEIVTAGPSGVRP